jgi:hypothetical protein
MIASSDRLQFSSSVNRLHRFTLAKALLVFGCAHFAQAQNFTLHEGEVAEYRFHFASPPTTPHGPINFLGYQGGMAWTGTLNLQVSLYDGEHLLGSHLVADDPAGVFMRFAAFGSPQPSFRTQEFVDFSTLVNGTIDGRLTFQIFHPFPEEADGFFDLDISLLSGRQETTQNFWSGGPNPVLDSVSVHPASAVPEPSTYGFVFAAASLALVGGRLRRQNGPRN